MSRSNKIRTIPNHATPTFAETVAITPVGVEVLLDILRRPRFSSTEGEAYVIDTYIRPLAGCIEDGYGNFWVEIPDADGKRAVTMFSSHLDTVHKRSATGTYKLSLQRNWLKVAGEGGVLGADCGTGVWIMLNLIAAGVPGLYVFHRDEEIGGGGSSYIAENLPGRLEGIKHCIAFDRKATSHVITHQGGSRCCSDAFANAFADLLNLGSGMEFEPNDGGSFTDSANYTHLIPECTNLSIGYYDQHTMEERQDLSFAAALVLKLISLPFDQLPAERDPEAEEDYEDDWRNYFRQGYYSNSRVSRAEQLVEEYPHVVADLLDTMGIGAHDLELYIAEVMGASVEEL